MSELIIQGSAVTAESQHPPVFSKPHNRVLDLDKTSLTARTIAAVEARFAAYGHHPSPEHWDGLQAIAQHIEDQAEGLAGRTFALSHLPTGMGKTTVLIEALRQITSDPSYAHVGIAVFASRKDQVEQLIAELPELDSPDSRERRFAVVTGNANVELNQRGRGHFNRKGEWVSGHQDAQVLFTTQAKLLTVSRQREEIFRGGGDYETFWKFNGEPRQVRVWDEAVMPAKPLVITPNNILQHAAKIGVEGKQPAADRLRTIAADIIRAASDGETTFRIPELLDYSDDELAALDEFREADSVGDILGKMAGKDVRLYRDLSGQMGAGTFITYREFLPANLAPMLILDASGDLRVTYKAWQEGRGGLTVLPSAPKTYHNLTVRHWDSPAGKAAYRVAGTRRELAEAAVRAIQSVPQTEDVLIILRKEEKEYSVSVLAEIKQCFAAMGGDVRRIKAVYWGFHTASNEFANIKHVVVLGLLQYSDASNEAHWRAAFGLGPQEDAQWMKVEELRLGEIAHHLFQGVGRGAVRKTVNGDVPLGCTLHVVFATWGNMHIPSRVLSKCFPGAKVEAWHPLGVRLRSGRHQTHNREVLVDEIVGKMGDRAEFTFRLVDLELVGAQSARRFLREPLIHAALAEKGLRLEIGQVNTGKALATAYHITRVAKCEQMESANG